MKNLTILLSILFFLGIATVVNANNGSKEPSSAFLLESLTKVGDSKKGDVLLNAVDEMKRISKSYPDNWLAPYYQCYFSLEYCLYNNLNIEKTLDNVRQTLPILESKEQADLSEVYTLYGYYNYVMVQKNPSLRGKAYYKKIDSYYEKAITLNPANPRPRILKHLLEQRMGVALGYTVPTDIEEINAITALLDEEDALLPAPIWGDAIWSLFVDKE